VQIFDQDTKAQTAEEHYRLEEMMGEFERNYRDLKSVEKLIKKGDKYFYEFLFDHKRINKDILNLMAEHAKTKNVRDQANKLLK
jgi:hypothetical protein